MRFLNNSEGFAGVILVALIGTGLVTALLGLVVDGGSMLFERRAQQTVADYSVEILGKDCLASYAANCSTGQLAINHLDQVRAAALSTEGTTILEACGPLINRSNGGVPCSTLQNKTINCQAIPTEYQNSFIRVRTGKTPSATGQPEPYKVLSWFPAFANGYSTSGCAQAAIFGSVAATTQVALPIVLPSCRTAAVGVSTVLVGITPSLEKGNSCQVDTISGTRTETSISGFTLASLNSIDRTTYCLGASTSTLDVGLTLNREPNEKTDLCGASMVKTNLDRLLNKTLYFPTVGPPINNGLGNYAFLVRAFTAFKLTGYKLKVGSSTTPSAAWWLANGCSNNQYCITGSFQKAVSQVSKPLTTTTQFATPNLDLITVLRLY
jgi:hypothetical protein